MAKKLYHLPLQRIRDFLQEYKSTLNSAWQNSKKLEYTKRFGKALYLLEIERFISFLKIDNNLDYALKLISYFESQAFLGEIMSLMRIEKESQKREYLYMILYYLNRYKPELFVDFLQQSFMHYHTSQTPKTTKPQKHKI